MKIEIVPIVETNPIHVQEKTEVERTRCGQVLSHAPEPSSGDVSSSVSVESVLVIPQSTTTLEDIFGEFLQLEVGDGAASKDTIRNYLSQTKQYLDWCRDNLLSPLEADQEDIKLYRQYLLQSGYANSTIATKLNIIRIFYKAALAHGLIENNPVQNIKAPKERKDPAARITFMEAEELKFLLVHIQSQLNEAKTNKQRLMFMRDRVLIGIMSLEGCRTVEMHNLKIEDIVRQGIKTGLQVSAKRASRVVPLTEN
ncbi:MAG: tyrosine-type recombinase/integrase, partial [Waterburya sp.]